MDILSQRELEEISKKRNNEKDNEIKPEDKAMANFSNTKIINEIINDGTQPVYKYKLPELTSSPINKKSIPYVSIEEYPKLNIQGKYSSSRQVKGANLYLLKEIDFLLNRINEGKNKNATINFLIWVGLQSLKGVGQEISINVHDSVYADGGAIARYILEESIDELE